MAHAPGFLKIVNEAKSQIQELSLDQVLEKISRGDSFLFVDVREDEEWNAGRAKGAVHLGKGIIERDIESRVPDRSAEIVLYCGGGFRSALAAESLEKMGYQRVFSMAGGWRAWVDAGAPVKGKT